MVSNLMPYDFLIGQGIKRVAVTSLGLLPGLLLGLIPVFAAAETKPYSFTNPAPIAAVPAAPVAAPPPVTPTVGIPTAAAPGQAIPAQPAPIQAQPAQAQPVPAVSPQAQPAQGLPVPGPRPTAPRPAAPPLQRTDALTQFVSNFQIANACRARSGSTDTRLRATVDWLRAAEKEFTNAADRGVILNIFKDARALGGAIYLDPALTGLSVTDAQTGQIFRAEYLVRRIAGVTEILVSPAASPGRKSANFQIAIKMSEALASLQNQAKQAAGTISYAGVYDARSQNTIFSENQVTNRWLEADPVALATKIPMGQCSLYYDFR